MNVGASSTPGQLTIPGAVRGTIQAAIDPPAQRWLYETVNSASYVHFLSFNTPVDAAASAQCGRVVFTGMHVSDRISNTDAFPSDPTYSDVVVNTAMARNPNPGPYTTAKTPASIQASFPGCCANRTALSGPEKALEFMIFDLSSCVVPVTLPPPPIPTVTPPPVASVPPPASPPPPTVPAAPPPPPAAAPPPPPPPATIPPAPPAPPVPAPPAVPPPVAAPPPPPAPPPSTATPPPPPPPPLPPGLIY